MDPASRLDHMPRGISLNFERFASVIFVLGGSARFEFALGHFAEIESGAWAENLACGNSFIPFATGGHRRPR
jgi:hypothetical protein